MHRPPLRRLAGLAAGVAIFLSLTAPAVSAKEGLEVRMAAPLPADAQPGSTVAALFSLNAISEAGQRPLSGPPVFIRLYGPQGAMTEAAGVEQSKPGTYRAMVEIPAGGARRADFRVVRSPTDASGKTVRSDLIWPYDGLLVAAAVPAPVDPESFVLPGTKPAAADPATDPAAVPAADPVAGALGGSATASSGAVPGARWTEASLASPPWPLRRWSGRQS